MIARTTAPALIALTLTLFLSCATYAPAPRHWLLYERQGYQLPTFQVGPFHLVLIVETVLPDSTAEPSAQKILRGFIQSEYYEPSSKQTPVAQYASLHLDSVTFIPGNRGVPSHPVLSMTSPPAIADSTTSLPAWLPGPTFTFDNFPVDTAVSELGVLLVASAVNLLTDSIIQTDQLRDYLFPNGSAWTKNQRDLPNPFSPTTTIDYSVLTPSHVLIVLRNVSGQVVDTVVNADMKPGRYQKTVESTTLTSGVYFYTATIGGTSYTKKMVIMR